MEFADLLISYAVYSAGILLWAKWSNLDLGLSTPVLRGTWSWTALYMAWIGAEGVIAASYPVEVEPEWLDFVAEMSLAENLALTVIVGPIFEEVLFRGAIFSALIRRWGIAVAVIVPSLAWGLIHVQYEAWFAASIAGSGIILAIIRWKSNSLFVPIMLHAGFNLVDLLAWYPLETPAGS